MPDEAMFRVGYVFGKFENEIKNLLPKVGYTSSEKKSWSYNEQMKYRPGISLDLTIYKESFADRSIIKYNHNISDPNVSKGCVELLDDRGFEDISNVVSRIIDVMKKDIEIIKDIKRRDDDRFNSELKDLNEFSTSFQSGSFSSLPSSISIKVGSKNATILRSSSETKTTWAFRSDEMQLSDLYFYVQALKALAETETKTDLEVKVT